HGDHSGGHAGEWMDIAYNTVLYTVGNSIHLRGTPRKDPDAPDTLGSVGMTVRNNVFAADRSGGAIVPGALLQNESGLYDYNNLFDVNTFDQRRQCDFDGDGAPDDFIATGA